MKDRQVLVLYTGGTIGMTKSENGTLSPEPHLMEKKLQSYPQLHDSEYPAPIGFLALPDTNNEFRVLYTIREYDPLLDSSNMSMEDWINIALDIQRMYAQFDGFVILHGTDTMAYTASALSFMLENLGKSVVITGSQIPLYEPRSDGRDNFLNALIIAGNYIINEVTIMFSNKLLRGNRTIKLSASSLDAFASPNFPPLATIGIDINVDRNLLSKPPRSQFRVHSSLNQNVCLLRLFPSIAVKVLKAHLVSPIEGIVLETYGSGNAPTSRKDILEEIRAAVDRGIIIVNCTQCPNGRVGGVYETGNALFEAGVIAGADMTTEAALTKLAYVLSHKEWTLTMKKRMLQENLRGELS